MFSQQVTAPSRDFILHMTFRKYNWNYLNKTIEFSSCKPFPGKVLSRHLIWQISYWRKCFAICFVLKFIYCWSIWWVPFTGMLKSPDLMPHTHYAFKVIGTWNLFNCRRNLPGVGERLHCFVLHLQKLHPQSQDSMLYYQPIWKEIADLEMDSFRWLTKPLKG